MEPAPHQWLHPPYVHVLPSQHSLVGMSTAKVWMLPPKSLLWFDHCTVWERDSIGRRGLWRRDQTMERASWEGWWRGWGGRQYVSTPPPPEIQEEAAATLDFSTCVIVRKQASALCRSLCVVLLDHHRTDTDPVSPLLVTWKSRHPGDYASLFEIQSFKHKMWTCGWTVKFWSQEANALREPGRLSANLNQYEVHFFFKYPVARC